MIVLQERKELPVKILEMDLDYYDYPQGISCLDDFIAYVRDHGHTFMKLTRFETQNCLFPYFIREEKREMYVNMATVGKISEVEATVLCRREYDARLAQIVKQKCADCAHYEEDDGDDHLKGHRDRLSLDGECWGYEKKS